MSDQREREGLKSCPFCGEPADPRAWSGRTADGEPLAGPGCTECGASADVDAWNRRPVEDALRAELAEARGVLERIASESEHMAGSFAFTLGEWAREWLSRTRTRDQRGEEVGG